MPENTTLKTLTREGEGRRAIIVIAELFILGIFVLHLAVQLFRY